LGAQSQPSGASPLRAAEKTMRTHYDFTKAKKNPYARRLKRQITIRIDEATIAYFKSLAMELDMPYQALINLYRRDCAPTRHRLPAGLRCDPAWSGRPREAGGVRPHGRARRARGRRSQR